MNEGMLKDAILWEGKPKRRWVFLGVPINRGSLTVWLHQVGVVMQDGKVVDIFSEGKKKLPWKGEVRTYVASTSPFDLKFDLKDPFGAGHQGTELDQFVLTRDREVVTGSVDLRLRVVPENVEHLQKLLAQGSGIVTQQQVSDRIKTELQAKVLALDIHRHTSEELRGNRELFQRMYESVKIEMSSSIRFFGLQLDNFYPNWGLTHKELEKIHEQSHLVKVKGIKWEQEIEDLQESPLPPDPLGKQDGGWKEIGYSFKNGRKSMEDVPDWVKERIPKYRRMFYTTDRHSGKKSYCLNGKTFRYRISFSRVHGGTDLRVYKTLREK